MLEFVTSIGIDVNQLLLILLVASLVFTLLYKKYTLNLFDPLTMFIIGMVANTALMFGLPWEAHLKWEFAGYAFFLWLGFAISSRCSLKLKAPLLLSSQQLFDLDVVLALLFALIILANLYLGATIGFPLFSDSPSVAKVTSFSGGVGLVRRIGIGPQVFLCCGCVFMTVVGHRRKTAIALLAISSAFSMLSGAKGALLTLIYAQALVLGHPGLNRNLPTATIKKYALCTLVVGTGVALAVTIKDQGSVSLGVLGLFKRILLTGDVILEYFAGRERVMAASQQSLLGYLQYLMGDSLSMLRLSDYTEPLGSVILGAGNNGFGPNAQYFVVADLFFGPIFGCIYSLAVGYSIGYFRSSFINSSESSPMLIVLKLTLAVQAFAIATEAAYFFSSAVITLLIVVPLFFLAKVTRLACHSMAVSNKDHMAQT